MPVIQSLRFKLLLGFIAVFVPLAAGLYVLNFYAMKVVRDEVSQSTTHFLSMHVSQIDGSLEKASNYLLRLSFSKLYYSDLIGLSLLPQDSSEYFFAKQRIFNSFQDEINSDSYLPMDTFFAYTAKYKELIATQITFASSQKIQSMLSNLVEQEQVTKTHNWQIVQQDGHSYFLRVEQIRTDVYVGALIPAENLIQALRSVNLGSAGQAFIVSHNATPLTDTTWNPASLKDIVDKLSSQSQLHQTMESPDDKKSYLLMGFPLSQAPAILAVTIPDNDLLQNLPYFQRVLIWLPIVIVALLFLFSFVLKQVLHKPMTSLIRGMRRMAQGDFSIRLEETVSSEEFRFLNQTFNRMVKEIRQLKINVYEEMLKAQEAEFQHLQAQINPHFFLNSLNIIYSLSKLGRNELVEKMSHHLAEYFRFITRANRQCITLEEELEHIRNYLEIQRLRFPNKLTFQMKVPDEYRSLSVLPLMIQPFVENAIKHGMKIGREVFHISVEVRPFSQNPRMTEIRITDNGIGFPKETLERLRCGMPADPVNAKSMGILNVQNRLKHKFGDSVSLQFRNRTEEGDEDQIRGAQVILRIQSESNEEEEERAQAADRR